MTYQVLARKWRPQAFDAVVGQEAVTRTLLNALASGRVAHAYLFTGPRGVGKTTTARLLAKALACTARTGPEACGACPSCQDFASGAPTDVLEIDAASNNGVEEIRTLRENVKYAPARGRFKVYIVDEVHMLSGPAFNAFLKTLEEPPPHVVFVLATTDPRKIPLTVLSRCQRFDFKPIAPERLAATLGEILTKEQIGFDPAALPLLVRAAEGSVRDALSLLDAAIAYGEGHLDEAGVARLLGSSSPGRVRAFVGALLGRDGGAALEAVDHTARQGEDLDLFCRDAIEGLRRLLVRVVSPAAPFAELTAAEAGLLEQAGPGADELIFLLRAFVEAQAEMRRSPHPRVELEIATVRATQRPRAQALEALIAKIEEAERRLRAGGGGPAPRPATAQASLLDAAPEPGPRPGPSPRPASPPRAGAGDPAQVPRPASAPARHEPRAEAAPGPRAEAGGPAAVEIAGEGEAGEDAVGVEADGLGQAWQQVIADVLGRKALLGTVLQHATPQAVRDGALVVSLAGNHFHTEMLGDRANREVIAAAVERHVPGARRIEVTAGTPGPLAAGPLGHPVVQSAIAAFQAEVVAVRPRLPEEGDSA